MHRNPRAWILFAILAVVFSPVDSWSAGKPNIVLITLDSMRWDRMGFAGNRANLTPSLGHLAHDSIVFERAYAQAPDPLVSTATILTGSYPQVHRASPFSVPLSPTLPYLPDLLHTAGYHTAAFVGSVLLDPRQGPFQGYDRGFDDYAAPLFQLLQHAASRSGSVALHGEQVTSKATKWLTETNRKPFFLWINLPSSSASGTSYDRSVAESDAAVGQFIKFLRAQLLYDEALIVVASTNGESLGAHGEDTHGTFLYDETVHVPLILKLPGNRMAGKKASSRARLLDIAPTVLEIAAVSVPSQMQAQSLTRIVQAQTDQPAYARSDLPQLYFGCSRLESWRAGKYLYIRAPHPELYDMVADPGASHNLAQSSKATLDTMASQLQAFDARLANQPDSRAASGLTSSEMQKLASLGYVGLQKSTSGINAASEGADPKDAIAAINKTLGALSDLDNRQPEKATTAFRPVLTSQPSFYLAQYAMGEALVQRQQYAEAIGYLHRAIELQPESPWAHLTMGLSLMQTNDFKAAAIHLEIASARLPKFSMLHSKLAEAYQHLGRAPDAERERTLASQSENKRN